MKFMELFKISEDYPNNVAERGLPQNYLYCYISSSFLDGFINYVEPIKGYVCERYENWIERGYPSAWKDIIKEYHCNFHAFRDDVVLLCESKNSYWFFWYDQDCSDCCIGRVDKSIIQTKDSIICKFRNWIKENECFKDGCFEIPIKHLKSGWRSFD